MNGINNQLPTCIANVSSNIYKHSGLSGAFISSWSISEGPDKRPEGGGGLNGSLKSDSKNRRVKVPIHPTHLKQWVSVPHSLGRLSTLGTLTHRNQHKHAEAKRWRAQTKHAYSRNRTKADQSETIEKEYSENSNKEVSRQVNQKLEWQEINLTSKNTQDTNFCLLFQVLTKPYQKLINIDQRRRGLTRTN